MTDASSHEGKYTRDQSKQKMLNTDVGHEEGEEVYSLRAIGRGLECFSPASEVPDDVLNILSGCVALT